MNQIVEYQLSDGSHVRIQATEPKGSAAKRSADKQISKATDTFKNSMKSLRQTVDETLQELRSINNTSEIIMELGVKFSAEAGIFLASVDSEATFKVQVKWRTADS